MHTKRLRSTAIELGCQLESGRIRTGRETALNILQRDRGPSPSASGLGFHAAELPLQPDPTLHRGLTNPEQLAELGIAPLAGLVRRDHTFAKRNWMTIDHGSTRSETDPGFKGSDQIIRTPGLGGGLKAAADAVAEFVGIGIAIGPLVPARVAIPLGIGIGGKNVIQGIANGSGWQILNGASTLVLSTRALGNWKQAPEFAYRGYHAGHPALEAALEGKISPQNPAATLTPTEHCENFFVGGSQYTSWTTSRMIAQMNALKNGPGGIVVRVRLAPAPKGATWKWVSSPDTQGESEILMEGVRSDATLHKKY